MILGGLETLCLGVVFLLLLVLAALFNLALLGQPRQIPGRFLTRDDASPVTLDTAFKLGHYFPLPPGYAFTERDDGTPIVVRIDDQLPLKFTVADELLTFEELYIRSDGTTGTRRHKVARGRNYSFTGAIGVSSV